jgi:membrane-bound ClpP family serine protease
MLLVIVSLLLIGLVLIIVELVFIPGTTLVGLLGFIFAISGIVISYRHYGSEVGLYVLSSMAVITLVTLVFSLRSGAWSKFSLKSSMNNKVNEELMSTIQVGDSGTTISVLRPYGKAEINSQQYEVKSFGNFVSNGVKVKVTHILSNQIIVEPLQ